MSGMYHFLFFRSAIIFLIHSANPQSRPSVITFFTRVVRLSVRNRFSKFSILRKASENSDQAEWIIEDTCLVSSSFQARLALLRYYSLLRAFEVKYETEVSDCRVQKYSACLAEVILIFLNSNFQSSIYGNVQRI